ncbi:MAG: hypothetical protein AB7G13_20485 [Lautropia sp.]
MTEPQADRNASGGGAATGLDAAGATVTATATAAAAVTVPLRRAAHGRTGDKGNRSNISVIAWHPQLYAPIVASVTEAAVAARFAHRRPSRVTRYLLPNLHALNFVIDDVLDGGVNDALNLDSHGKSLSFLLLELPVELPRSLLPLLRGPAE